MLIVLDFIWIISKSAAKIQQIPETHMHFRNLFSIKNVVNLQVSSQW